MSIHASLLTIPTLKACNNCHIGILPLLERVYTNAGIEPTAEDWYIGFKHVHDCQDSQIEKCSTDGGLLGPSTRCVKYVRNPGEHYDYCRTETDAFTERQIIEYMIENDKHWSELFESESEFLISCIRFGIVTSLKYSLKGEEREVVIDKTLEKKFY